MTFLDYIKTLIPMSQILLGTTTTGLPFGIQQPQATRETEESLGITLEEGLQTTQSISDSFRTLIIAGLIIYLIEKFK